MPKVKLTTEEKTLLPGSEAETQEVEDTETDTNEISKETRSAIEAQVVKEIQFNRRYKQGKIKNWQKNEVMVYGAKLASSESRSNVELGRMHEFVQDILSKIDNPLQFKFRKKKSSQLKRVERLNSLRDSDAFNDDWDIKDIVGKKQAVIYGRATYSYFADSEDGYQAHLTPIDVYDFLIDPSGGGYDIENALNMGDFGVVFSKEQLEDMKDDDNYIKEAIETLITGTGNNTVSPQEETNKRVRMYGQGTIGKKENAADSDNKYKFWRWCTTYYNPNTKKSERYYLLIQEKTGSAIRICKLTDLFPATKRFPLGPWPYWTWAAFLDLTEFWTPSYCDFVRELLMAQSVTINQGLDNSEQINKPQKLINVNAIESLAQLKYRRDGYIHVKNDVDPEKVMKIIQTPSTDNPIKIFNLLENIKQKASGVTSEINGTANTDGKVGIVDQNAENAADKFGLLNKSYAFGYKRFARLWELGVRTHLTKKVAIDIIGPDGIETEMVKRSDLFKKGDEYNLLVEASNAETQMSEKTMAAKVNFVNAQLTRQANPQVPKIMNEKKAFEVGAKAVGYEAEEIKELMDTSDYGNEELMSEVSRDIESLLDGDDIKPNAIANNAYRQKFLDWMTDHQEDLSTEEFARFTNYMTALEPIVMANEARAVQNHEINIMDTQSKQPLVSPEASGAPVATAEPQPIIKQ